MLYEIKIEKVKVPNWWIKTKNVLAQAHLVFDEISAAFTGNKFVNALYHGVIFGVGTFLMEHKIDFTQPIPYHDLYAAAAGGVFGMWFGYGRSAGNGNELKKDVAKILQENYPHLIPPVDPEVKP